MNGANDYITKPFETSELLARIKVQLRTKKNNNSNILKYKNLFLEKDTHYLFIDNKKIFLTKTENAILIQLLSNPKQILSKSRLLELLSNNSIDCDENSLKVHISNIRKKIKAISNNEYIESIWGIGFKMYD